MYWTSNMTNDIRRANFDGTGQETLPIPGLQGDLGITLDTENGKIYWTERGGVDIRRANLDGTGSETLVSKLGDPSMLALEPDPIPEPSTLALLGGGFGGLIACGLWRRRRAK